MMNTEAPPSQGLVAGKYQLVRLIGRGGMGSVWEARHVSLGTPSAIKFIESEYADSQEARSRFDKEAKAAATIQSKHAIQIYDHGVTDDGKPYIVMELLQGEPLDKRIDRLERMTLQDTARVLQQVCRGLARAHERGIIHRDLKPENIFIVRNSDDDDEVAKVLDFGIAKMQNGPGNPGMTSSTKTGAVLGTPFYMSPEQARGLRNVDHRTDVWSLAVIAFKCITGKLPFDGESVGDLLVKICTSPVPVPSQVLPGIPPSFDAWFMRAMEREPERRFSTVAELSDALCFAAGIATRSGQGASSQLAGPGVNSGMQVPSGGYQGNESRGTYPSQPSNYGPNPVLDTRAHTPPTGAMTNAPFTSERVPGVPSGRGKLILGVTLSVLFVLGIAGGVIAMLKRPGKATEPVHGVVAAPPPPSVVSSAPAVPDKRVDPPADPASAAAVATAPAAASAAIKPNSKTPAVPVPKTSPTGKTPPGPTAPPLPPATTAAAPTAPPAPPAPPPKKPRDKNDPGY